MKFSFELTHENDDKPLHESTEKKSTARGGPVYVGVWATPTPPHIPLRAPRGWFFQCTHYL